ncbi:MAG TPA: glycoside hydrolase family 16 protein, partial [Candidatus Acidoferrales bacterium]|nr:glycoside hydrolase family 16 protein [Candidatus Acidoferrales bacterium]
DAAIAHGGTNYLKVYQAFNGSTNYDGIYQDYISGPGAVYAADGWAYAPWASDPMLGQNAAWIEVTFRDANANVLALYRSALVTSNSIVAGAFPKNQWRDLAITNQYDTSGLRLTNTVTQLVAPSGTIFVRYQIVFQGDANYSHGSMYFDDLNLSQTGGSPYGNMNIVWDDEFDGTTIKTNIWTYDIGNGGWGNNELEYYTSRTNNSFVANGLLHIVARQENYNGANYTSARMKSEGLFSFQYGRIEWRAQLPAGSGFWPALWMLGTNITTVGWPGCGEIDVLENNGSNPAMAQGSIHSGTDATAIYNFPDGGGVTNFNLYALDWTTNAILFYVNGHLYETQTGWGSSTGNAYPFPFNQPFFLIMNLAIGGNYLGNPTTNAINAGSSFPGQVLVDYVRIYNPTGPLRIAVQPAGAKLLLTWASNVVCRVQADTNLLATGSNAWVQVAANTNSLQITPGGGSAYYRLASP